MKPASPDLEHLQNEWKQMYQHKLPEAATSKSASQPKWPVHLDHCFARIILDSIIGIDTPWTQKIKSPAYKNMSSAQLQQSIEVGQKILDGKVDLVQLDRKSLELRGKTKGMIGKASGKLNKSNTTTVKRKIDDREEGMKEGENGAKRKKRHSPAHEEDETNEKSPYFEPKKLKSKSSPKSHDREGDSKPTKSSSKSDTTEEHSKLTKSPSDSPKQKESPLPINTTQDPTNSQHLLSLLTLSPNLTPFQKRVLSLLLQIPRGKYTTYLTLSSHLSSSPRAVGNALRNNPFAPQVPCHRVLATGGGLGGFHGSWGRKGKEGLFDEKKRELLRAEGVRFDGKGRVVGGPWVGFV